jgi:hypothetical protein
VKIAVLTAIMSANGGEIEVKSAGIRIMGGTSKKPEKGKPAKAGGKKPPPPAAVEDDDDDGDFATPKRDRNGDDDQPL